MALTAKQKSKLYREKKIAEMGLEAYRKSESEKRKARREKKKAAAAALAPPPQTQPPPSPSVPADKTKELKQAVKRLNEYLSVESKIDVPTVIKFVQKNLITNVVDIIESKNCDLLKHAVFIAKNKFLEKGVSAASHKQHFDNISRLYKYITKEEFKCTPSEFELFKDTKRVLNAIDTNPAWKKANSKNQYKQDLASILKYLNGYEDAYKVYSKVSTIGKKAIQKKQDDLKLSDKEKKNFVLWPVLEKASESEKLNTEEKALVGLYTLVPPRRREMSRVLTLTNTEKNLKALNYLVVDKNNKPRKIVMNKYKTFKSYGTYEMKLPAKLKTLLKKHLEDNDIQVGEAVFKTKKTKGYYQASNWSNKIQTTLKKATGKRVSFNLLRHSKIQHFLSTKRNLNQKKELAKQMGHDPATQARYDKIFKEEEIV